MSSAVNLFNNSSAILTGKEGCECIDASSVLASLVDKSCQTPDGENGVKARTDATHCVPYVYGSNSCIQHDLETDPACQKTSLDSKIPDYCHETWCYVDKSCARLSDERVARSVYFPGVVSWIVFFYLLLEMARDFFSIVKITLSCNLYFVWTAGIFVHSTILTPHVNPLIQIGHLVLREKL